MFLYLVNCCVSIRHTTRLLYNCQLMKESTIERNRKTVEASEEGYWVSDHDCARQAGSLTNTQDNGVHWITVTV